MPKLTIDQREVEVPPGATLLDAARKLNIDVPTLCHLDGLAPSTSCLVCMVKIRGRDRLVPACGTLAEDGMEIDSETEEVHQVRRAALELLLSDHVGDCLAPCYFGCPAHMDIPLMLRQIASGDVRAAIATIKRDIALPAVLGRICPAPCEKVCRRKEADGALSICLLKRFAADADISADERYLPPCRPASGKRVAILGAGPAGLAAAYYLLQGGHACTIFDENEKPGGRLRHETDESQLPRGVIDADVQPIVRLGAEMHMGTRIEGEAAFAELQDKFDAILVACGATAKDQADAWGLKTAPRGIQVDKETYRTNREDVFAAGNAIRSKGLVVRSVADGKEAALAIDQYLSGQEVTGPSKPFNMRMGRLEPDEIQQFLAGASPLPRKEPSGEPGGGFTPHEAAGQAARCLHCDCRAQQSCKLRKYAERYGADPQRYAGRRRPFRQDAQHAEVIYEPGKCIDCGLCIEIARKGGEPLGLTFIGRGFDVRVGVPLDRPLRDALQKVAAQCVEACPTAALEKGVRTIFSQK